MKVYLTSFLGNALSEDDLRKMKPGDKIIYEMPSFCSGDYEGEVKSDSFGLYMDEEECFFGGCRDFEIVRGLSTLEKFKYHLEGMSPIELHEMRQDLNKARAVEIEGVPVKEYFLRSFGWEI